MYRLADKLLEQLKKLIRREFNRLGILGFDELNAPRVTRETTELFSRLMSENKKRYLEAAKKAYSNATYQLVCTSVFSLLTSLSSSDSSTSTGSHLAICSS